MPEPTKSECPPASQMLQMCTAYWVSQSIYAAAKLGLADLVASGPKTSEELAKATETHAPSLYRLLRALASVGVFAEDEQHRFGLTPLAECLLAKPGSQRAMAIMAGEEHLITWGDILHSIRTGGIAFDHSFGKPYFDFLAERPDKAGNFDEAMTGVHGAETSAVLDAYDFSDIGTLVDVGGGNGTVIKAILGKYPQMKGILFDRPHVVDRARKVIETTAIASRCQAVGGSFFESVPAGGDAYLMRHIIHDWTDEQCRTILGCCRKMMKPGNRLLVLEIVIPPGNAPSWSKLLDLNMLLIPGGKERTEVEYRDLYASAGFKLTRIVPTRMELSVIEGTPV